MQKKVHSGILNLSCQALILILAFTTNVWAFEWSTTELHGQYGNLDTPSFAGGGNSVTTTLTLQHADGYKYGDNFFFVDFISSSHDEFNNDELYGELYTNLSVNKIRGSDPWSGLLQDFGFTMGINMASDAKVRKYLPGIRFDFNIPGFNFAHLLVTAYIDDSEGVKNGGAPKEGDSYAIDFSWARPFSIKDHDFSIEGHVEYIGKRDNEFGEEVSWHILAQPQIRYDLGKSLLNKPGQLFIGTELQLWINKLGDSKTTEFAPQALIVWRF